MDESILNSTKKILGLDADYDAFDLDVITHINSSFFTLNQLGIGPAEGFMIEDDTTTWDVYTQGRLNLNAVKTYVYLSVRLVFDPPGTAHHITAMKEQITELQHRLKLDREVTAWNTTPSSSPSLP